MLSSGVILAGLLGSIFGWNLDKFAALLVVVLIARAAIAILVDALRVLLDASIDFKTMDQVKTIIMKNPAVVSINALWGRNSGPYKFIEADIVVQAGSLERSHFFVSKIEKDIREKILGANSHLSLVNYQNGFNNWEEVLDEVMAVDGIKAASPYIEKQVLVIHNDNTYGIMYHGIDPDTAATIAPIAVSIPA